MLARAYFHVINMARAIPCGLGGASGLGPELSISTLQLEMGYAAGERYPTSRLVSRQPCANARRGNEGRLSGGRDLTPASGADVFDIHADLIHNRFVRESFRGDAVVRQCAMLCPVRPTPAILQPGHSDRETGVEVIKASSMPQAQTWAHQRRPRKSWPGPREGPSGGMRKGLA
jgi:hypothetical protein